MMSKIPKYTMHAMCVERIKQKQKYTMLTNNGGWISYIQTTCMGYVTFPKHFG